jgi:ribosomal protein S18 acetylase RimI-like enzyme
MVMHDYDQMIALWTNMPGIGLSDADSEENITRFLERNAGLSLVCETDGRIVGTVLCGHDGRRGYIYHLAVDDALRKKGIGKKLIEQSLAGLQQAGIAKCHLFLFNDNEIAIAFYEKTGWKKRENLLIYSKELQ